MAEYSSRSDELWNFAATLFEEESKSIPFAKQEEHWQIIQAKYSQLVSNLSCLGDIIAMMYQEKKLTLKELEQIQHLQSTPIRANEELLSIIARKPRDVFECFLILIKNTNQHHLYQMLVSGDETFDEANGKDASKHEDLIRRNFMWLSEKMDTENGLISLLYQQNVLTVREREAIFGLSNTFQRNEILLGMLSKKSSEHFKQFLNALDASGQCHLTKKLRQLQDSPADSATVTPGVSRPTIVDHKQRQRSPKKSGQLHEVVPLRCPLKPVPPPKPGTKSTSVQRYANTAYTAAKSSKEIFTFRRTDRLTFQAWLRRLESRLQSDIAIKVTSVSLFNSDRPADYRTMWFYVLLQECRQTRKEIVSRNDETNMELEQLRKSARQYSTAATLNEVLRTQLLSIQQELTNERLRSKKELMNLKETVSKLKTDINNEKSKCRRFEADNLLSKTAIMEMKDSLSKAEHEKRCYLEHIHELDNRSYELQKSKDNFKEGNTEVISLRTESEKLKEECEILRKEKATLTDLEEELLRSQENSRALQVQLNEMKNSLERAEEENLWLSFLQKDNAEEKSLENDRISKLQEELRCEKRRAQVFEDKLSNATAQLEQFNKSLDAKDRTFATRAINGLAILGEDVFISRLQSPYIEVYNSATFDFQRQMYVDGINNAEHIVSCPVNRCLYAVGVSLRSVAAIQRIHPANGDLIKIWTVPEGGYRMSVASDTNVILNINHEAKLLEYTADGELIRKINLSSATGVSQVWHAVKLHSGLFVVCHSDFGDLLSRVCLLSTKRTDETQGRIDEAGILATFGEEQENSIRLKKPTYLSLSPDDSILVSDTSKMQVLLLSSNLVDPRILISEEHGLGLPGRTCFGESECAIIVADYHYVVVCRVVDGKIHRERYDLSKCRMRTFRARPIRARTIRPTYRPTYK